MVFGWLFGGGVVRFLRGLFGCGVCLGVIEDFFVCGGGVCGWVVGDGLGGYGFLRGFVGREFRWLPEACMNPHMLVVGVSGWGKTYLLRKLVTGLVGLGRCVVVFDYLGLFRDVVGGVGGVSVDVSRYPIHPFSLAARRECGLPSGAPSARVRAFAEALATAMGVGVVQVGLLVEAVMRAFKARGIREGDPSTWGRDPPTIQDVLRYVGGGGIEEGVKLRVRLTSLAMVYESREPLSIARLRRLVRERKAVALDMSGCDPYVRVFMTDILLRRLTSYAEASGTKLGYVVVIDEAKYAGFFERGVGEGVVRPAATLPLTARNYGLTLITATQGVTHIPPDILRNTATKVIGTLTHPPDLNYIQEATGIDPQHPRTLSRGEAIVTMKPTKTPPKISEVIIKAKIT